MDRHEVVVIGAGPAGISAALALEDRGVKALLVDRAGEPAESWTRRYERLRLNTCRWFSHLPDRPFEKGAPMFATSAAYRRHLLEHLQRSAVEFRPGTTVERIERANGGWLARTDGGEIHTRQVVLATGHQSRPAMPAWAEGGGFAGTVAHAADYRNAEPFAGRRVLVVGPGCSGMEIAYDLADGGASEVSLAVRTPPNIVLREGPAGLPGDAIGVALLHAPVRLADAFERIGRRQDIGDLSEYGLPVPEEGLFARFHREGTVPSIVDREVIEAIRDRRIRIVAAVEALDGSGALLADGSRLDLDAVICATGYRPTLSPIVGHLGVLDERGLPLAQGATAPAPGMRFIGYITRPGALGYMGKQAKRAARAIRRELRSGAGTSGSAPEGGDERRVELAGVDA